MSAYSHEEESQIRVQELVREWQRSEFLTAAQATSIEAELRPDLRRTNVFFRAVLFVFTLLIAGASVGFVAVFFRIDDRSTAAALAFVGAVICAGAAQFLVSAFRVYRFGVEEALAYAAALLLTFAVAVMFVSHSFDAIPALSTAALASLGIYLWFGYVEAAVISMACAAAIPFNMEFSAEERRLIAAAVLLAIFVFVRTKRRQHSDDFPGDQYGIFQAASWAGVYVAVNFQLNLFWLPPHGKIYWLTYVAIWLLPIIGLRFGLRERDRLLILVSAAMALGTLVTNKPYLGLARKPWDPILFGLFLMASAILIKRWLARGPNAERYGYTAKRLLASDRRLLTIVGTASAALQPNMPAPSSDTAAKPEFDGGRSGGAGASGSF